MSSAKLVNKYYYICIMKGSVSPRAQLLQSLKEHALRNILRVGTSDGGAEAKAVIAWSPKTNEVRAGQVQAIEQQFRRIAFDIVARNQDDHVKNIAFLMNKSGESSLAPAFDVTYRFNPAGAWTACHQMTTNGKRERLPWTTSMTAPGQRR